MSKKIRIYNEFAGEKSLLNHFTHRPQLPMTAQVREMLRKNFTDSFFMIIFMKKKIPGAHRTRNPVQKETYTAKT